MVSVKYENVKIAYDDFVAIKGVSLEVPHGEITTLLGPSGCGKSTLLRSLAGFVEPYEGQIYIGNKEVTILPPQRRNTAMIFQNYALWPHMTIFKNVEYGLKLRLRKRIVYSASIEDGKISEISHMCYGASASLLEKASLIEEFVLNKSAEEIWNLTLEDLRQHLDIPKQRFRYFLSLMNLAKSQENEALFLLGSLRTAIRTHYELVVKELPEWLPNKKTRLERKKMKPLITHRLLWVTKPYFWVVRKTKFIDYKASKDEAFAFRKKKVEDVLDMIHLRDQIEKHPTELSGGQQQRIALARSIVVEPDVLLCDEPLSNLDAKLRKELRTEIRSIIKKIGMTSIYVTHDQEEALAISDRIAVMNIGFIEQYGTPAEVFNDPKTLFVAQFIGASTSTVEGKAITSNLVELKGGEQVKVSTKKPLKAGTELSLVFRPNVISFTTETDFSLEMKINTIEYLGNEIKITSTLKDESILNVDVEEVTDKIKELKVGDIVKAFVFSEKVLVFEDEKRVY